MLAVEVTYSVDFKLSKRNQYCLRKQMDYPKQNLSQMPEYLELTNEYISAFLTRDNKSTKRLSKG